jgi:hypothetical protein
VLAGSGWWPAVGATGHAAVFTVPIAFAAATIARRLRASWAAVVDAADGAAVAGALGFAVAAVLFVAAAGWVGAAASRSLTHVPMLVGLTVGGFAVAAGAIAAAVSLPSARALSSVMRARWERRARPLSAERVLIRAGAAGAVAGVGLWLVVLVRAATGTTLGAGPYMATAAIVLAAAHLGAARMRRIHAAALAAVLAAALAGLTAYAATRPGALVEARARAPIGGLAIEVVHGPAERP